MAGDLKTAEDSAVPTTLALSHTADGQVLRITLNRPEVRNAMSMAMVSELRQTLRDAEASGRVRAVVLAGAGGHFCAGGDLRDMAQARMKMADGDEGAMRSVNAAFGELCVAFAQTPLATVAIVEGTVMGGGFGLACVADVAIAGESAVFRLPETSLGVVPAQIAPFLVARLGASEAMRLAITGARLNAQAALVLRLVHEVHPVAGLEAALERVLADILQCAPGAVAATKALIASARFAEPQSLVAAAADVFARALLSPEGVEGTTAFVQKRKPSWVAA